VVCPFHRTTARSFCRLPRGSRDVPPFVGEAVAIHGARDALWLNFACLQGLQSLGVANSVAEYIRSHRVHSSIRVDVVRATVTLDLSHVPSPM
jgi:hypothetical protein